MFYPLFFAIVIWIVAMSLKKGPHHALWLGWLTTLMLVPTWITTRYGGLILDLRTAAALAVLLGFALAGPAVLKASWRCLVLGDLLVLFFIGVQVYSQSTVGPFGPLTGPEMVRRMLLPYLMGRLCLRNADDLESMLPIVARLCLILSLVAMFESVVKINPVNKLLGKEYGLLEQGEGYRMGLKRAQGPLDHPIFFGMMLVMLYPWVIEAMRQAFAGQGPRWWRWLPLLMGGALFGTVSRGAQLAALATLLITLFFRKPTWRFATVAGVCLLGVIAYVNKEPIKEISSAMASENNQEPKIILVDGEEEEYTGTTHRILLFKVYREAIDRVGWLGYGYSLLRVPLEPEHEERFGSIDNHYLLLLLQHGWLAILSFLVLGACSLLYLIKAGWNPVRKEAGIAGSMAGSMGAVLVLLISVWFSPDFAAVWLFNAGLASALHCLPQQVTTNLPSHQEAPLKALSLPNTEFAPQVGRPIVPRLSPGHAPLRMTPTGEHRP